MTRVNEIHEEAAIELDIHLKAIRMGIQLFESAYKPTEVSQTISHNVSALEGCRDRLAWQALSIKDGK